VQQANQIPIKLSRIIGVIIGGGVIAALVAPHIAQDPAYHHFADTRVGVLPPCANQLDSRVGSVADDGRFL
jgi:hypothetical protein